MKIGFWTLLDMDTPWSNAQIADEAAARGFHGVDLRVARRGLPLTRDANIALDSSAEDIGNTAAAFASAGVEIASLNCYNKSPLAGDKAAWQAFDEELNLLAELASNLGTPRLRLIVEGPATGLEWDAYLLEVWGAVGRVMDGYPGLDSVIENHPGRATAAQLFRTAETVDDPRIGVALLPDHALVMQEDVLDLVERHCRHIHRVCISDRRVEQEDLARFDGRYYYVRYEACPNGEGVVPTGPMIERLRAGGFDDYVSLKYDKSSRFGFQLPPGIEALDHFPGYVAQFGIEPARV